MIPNNNLSVLPWYRSIEQQNARKWWIYGKTYPLFAHPSMLLPFQIVRPHKNDTTIYEFSIFRKDGSSVGDYYNYFRSAIYIKQFTSLGYDVIIYPGNVPVIPSLANGQYYVRLGDAEGGYFYSEVFTVVNDIEPYLKLEWWDVEDMIMDAGAIVYKYANNTQFKNTIYLDSDLAKPEYIFEEEGSVRDGYFFPIKMISEKKYRFSFLAAEYILDVLRFVRMADYAKITYHGQEYSLDTFLLSPTWEAEGDVAVVNAEFETATVAKKLGVGYIKSTRGDFNDDFDNSFSNNQ